MVVQVHLADGSSVEHSWRADVISQITRRDQLVKWNGYRRGLPINTRGSAKGECERHVGVRFVAIDERFVGQILSNIPDDRDACEKRIDHALCAKWKTDDSRARVQSSFARNIRERLEGGGAVDLCAQPGELDRLCEIFSLLGTIFFG